MVLDACFVVGDLDYRTPYVDVSYCSTVALHSITQQYILIIQQQQQHNSVSLSLSIYLLFSSVQYTVRYTYCTVIISSSSKEYYIIP